MKPLPKWAGWLGTLLAVLPSAYAAYQAGGWKAALALLVTIIGGGTTLFAHSAGGTGGTTGNP